MYFPLPVNKKKYVSSSKNLKNVNTWLSWWLHQMTTKGTFVNFFIKTYSVLLIQQIYKIWDAACFFTPSLIRLAALRFSKKPSAGRVKALSKQHFQRNLSFREIIFRVRLQLIFVFSNILDADLVLLYFSCLWKTNMASSQKYQDLLHY